MTARNRPGQEHCRLLYLIQGSWVDQSWSSTSGSIEFISFLPQSWWQERGKPERR
jgi:hypothetical protein